MESAPPTRPIDAGSPLRLTRSGRAAATAIARAAPGVQAKALAAPDQR
jgi:hypothetical protein